MAARIRVKFFTCFFLVSFIFTLGCEEEAYYPRITGTRPISRAIPVYHRPETIKVVERTGRAPWGWIPPRHVEKDWDAIIIHHSDTSNGNSAIFDKYHREEHHWIGVGYDFVIGNGTDSGDGQVEVTFRWRQQIVGAHTKTPNNWANEDGIGICLVGDFNKSRPSWKQLDSLTKLVRFLQRRYGIPTSRICSHKNCPGAHVTDCPGKNFSMWSFKKQL